MKANEDYVTMDVAKLLKKKGFNEPTLRCYIGLDGKEKYAMHKRNSELPQDAYSKASLWDAAKWLREKHGIMIDMNTDYYDEFIFIYQVWSLDKVSDEHGFGTYEKALNEGIKEALKLI